LIEVVRVHAVSGGPSSEDEIGVNATLEADLLVDKRGRVVTSFTAVWPQEALAELWRAAGLQVLRPWSTPVGVREIRHRYPGALPALQEDYDPNSPRSLFRHDLRNALLAIGALVGLLVLAFVVFWLAVIVTALRS
jgi:hypothetical protein